MNANLIVGGVETFSTVDFPDKIAAVVFMQGCPWRCPFCHNAFLQDASAADNFVWEKFVEFLKTRRGILDGVVFSGGEPLMQNGLAAAVADCKKFEKNLNLFGFRLNVSVKPGRKGCLYRLRSKTPVMTNGFAGEESRTPPHEIEINCRFSPEQRRQAADFIRSGGSSEYEFPVGRDSKATLQIMLPTEFLHDPQICTVSRRPESRTEPSAAEIKQQKV